jgi:subtilisin family serine protease
MAPSANIYSYDFDGDPVSEMANAVNQYGIVLSNNSWGYIIGWDYVYIDGIGWLPSWRNNLELFGKYTSDSSALDSLIIKKDLCVVFSAGNDRNDRHAYVYYYNYTSDTIEYLNYASSDGTYMTVGPTGSAKNVIAVGAPQGAKTMSEFGSWGPTRSGMLKPEISAPGVNIYSSLPGNSYGRMSGTSMAAPVVTGSLALLMEQWRDIHGGYPSPAVIRNLIALTATEVKKLGPDYEYGFGVLNTAGAAVMIDASATSPVIVEDKVKRNKTVAYNLTASFNAKYLRICLAWLDPAGPSLVNDIDLKVTDQNGKVYRPYTLNPNAWATKAKKQRNYRDNIELVIIRNVYAGQQFLIEVDGYRLGKGNRQKFVLAAYGY